MSSRLRTWMNQNAGTVSLENLTDGETELDVHVSPEPSLDAEVAELAEADIESQKITQDCEDLAEATATMERYADLLSVGLENGGISAATAAYMQVGLERYEDVFDDIVPSLEAFGGNVSSRRTTQVTLEKLGEKIEGGWEALKRALEALVRLVVEGFQRMMATSERLSKRADALAKKAGSINSGARQNKLTLGNPSRLFADGKYEGDNIALSAGYVDWINQSLLEGTIGYINKAATSLKSLTPSKDLSMKDVEFLFDMQKITEGLTKTSDSDKGQVYMSDTLPGNKAVFMTVVSARTPETLQKLVQTSSLKLADSDGKAAPTSHDIVVASPSNLKTQATKIKAAADYITKTKDKTNILKSAIDSLKSAGDTFEGKMKKAELSDESKKVAKAALKSVMVSQKMLGPINSLMTEAVQILNAQLAVIERQVALYGKQKETKDDGSDQRTLPAPSSAE